MLWSHHLRWLHKRIQGRSPKIKRRFTHRRVSIEFHVLLVLKMYVSDEWYRMGTARRPASVYPHRTGTVRRPASVSPHRTGTVRRPASVSPHRTGSVRRPTPGDFKDNLDLYPISWRVPVGSKLRFKKPGRYLQSPKFCRSLALYSASMTYVLCDQSIVSNVPSRRMFAAPVKARTPDSRCHRPALSRLICTCSVIRALKMEAVD